MSDTFWEGARRLPYFFTYIAPGYILCPQCAMAHDERERMDPRYHVNRTIMCVRCGVLIGPAGEGEMIEVG